jgi:hypothetical protein
MNAKHHNAGCDPAEKYRSGNQEPFRDPVRSGGARLLDEHVNLQAILLPRELTSKPGGGGLTFISIRFGSGAQ